MGNQTINKDFKPYTISDEMVDPKSIKTKIET